MVSPTTPTRDWTVQATETVESVVLSVKAKTTVLQTIARGIVYGLLIAALTVVLVLASVIGLIRIADVYLLGWAGRSDGHVRLWIAYLALGMVCSLLGFVCWAKRRPRRTT
jgi:hypothetical protein